MAKRDWAGLRPETKERYSRQGVTPQMYRYGMPLTSRTVKSEESIREDMTRRAHKVGFTEAEVDLIIFLIGPSEAWYLHRATEAARRARNAGYQQVATDIYILIHRDDLPAWIFWYQFR